MSPDKTTSAERIVRMPRRPTLRVLFIILGSVLYSRFALVEPAAAQPDPAACNPGNEGAIVYFLENGYSVKYVCYCARSGRPGNPIVGCVWLEQEDSSVAVSSWSSVEFGGDKAHLTVSLQHQKPNGAGPFTARSYGTNNRNGWQVAAPPRQLAVEAALFRWDGSNWRVCRDSGARYSPAWWSWMWVGWTFNSTPCGSGYYYTMAYSWVWDSSLSAWMGSGYGVSSGSQQWGCPLCRTAAPAEPPAAGERKAPPAPPSRGGKPVHPSDPELEVRGGPPRG